MPVKRLFRLTVFFASIAQIAFGAIFFSVPAYAFLEFWWPAFERWSRGEFSERESALVLFGFGAFGSLFLLFGLFAMASGIRDVIRILRGDLADEERKAKLEKQLISQKLKGDWLIKKQKDDPSTRPLPRIQNALARAFVKKDGVYTFSAKSLYRTGAFAVGGFAAFWNLVIILGSSDSIGRLGRWHAFDIFHMVFILPFVVVGLGLAGFAVYLFLASRHPALRVHIQQMEFQRGDRLEFRWDFEYSPTRLERLDIVLEIQETFIEGSGEDASKHSSVLKLVPIASNIPLRVQSSGAVSVDLPSEVEPSARSASREVEWVVKMHALGKRAPDLHFWVPLEVR